MLEKNRDNIGKALPGLAKYQITQGEAVANGYFYDAFVSNLLPSAAAAAVLGLRLRIPARSQRRATARHRRPARRTPVALQRHSRRSAMNAERAANR